jgi:hypothetical protein
MARIAYDRDDVAAFDATRSITDEGLTAWQEALGRHINPSPDIRMPDLGAGTGMWAVPAPTGTTALRSLRWSRPRRCKPAAPSPTSWRETPPTFLWATTASTRPGCRLSSTTCPSAQQLRTEGLRRCGLEPAGGAAPAGAGSSVMPPTVAGRPAAAAAGLAQLLGLPAHRHRLARPAAPVGSACGCPPVRHRLGRRSYAAEGQ